MAVSETKNLSSLKMKFDAGLNNEGKTIVKARTFSNLKSSASAQDVLDIAHSLSGLQEHDLLEVLKQDNTILN